MKIHTTKFLKLMVPAIAILALVLTATPVTSENHNDTPAIHIINGDINIDGEEAPPGTQLIAKLNDETRDRTTIEEKGTYQLYVKGFQSEVNDLDVTFHIYGVENTDYKLIQDEHQTEIPFEHTPNQDYPSTEQDLAFPENKNIETKETPKINQGDHVELEIENTIVSSIKITAENEIVDMEVSIAENTQKPDIVGETPIDKIHYKYLTITTEHTEDIKEPKITFEVSKDWINEENIIKNTVALYKWNDEWQTQPTELIKETDNLYLYKATVDSFSNFAVFGEQLIPEEHQLTIDIEGEGEIKITDEENNHIKTIDSSDSTNIKETTITLIATPETNWEFKEWQNNIQSEQNKIQLEIDNDKQLTAIFTEKTDQNPNPDSSSNSDPEEYTLSINVEGDGTTDPEPGNHTFNKTDEITIEALPDKGWKLLNWTGDIHTTNKEVTIAIDSDKEITANFQEPGLWIEVITPQKNLKTNQEIEFKLHYMDEPLENQTVWSNNQEITTDEYGTAKTTFHDPGTYNITTEKNDIEDTVQIEILEYITRELKLEIITAQEDWTTNEDIEFRATVEDKPIEGAAILINEKQGITDQHGLTSINFDKIGEYTIQINKDNEQINHQIITYEGNTTTIQIENPPKNTTHTIIQIILITTTIAATIAYIKKKKQ